MAGVRDDVELRAADPPRPLAARGGAGSSASRSPQTISVGHSISVSWSHQASLQLRRAAVNAGLEAGVGRGRQRHVDEVGGERRRDRRRVYLSASLRSRGREAIGLPEPRRQRRAEFGAAHHRDRLEALGARGDHAGGVDQHEALHERRRAQRELGGHPAAQRAAGDDDLVEPEPLAEALDRARVAGDRDAVRAGRGRAEAGQVDGDHAVRRAPPTAASRATPSSCRRARGAAAPAARPRPALRTRAGRGRHRPCGSARPRRARARRLGQRVVAHAIA